jgi:hypothetical protein
MKPFLIPLNTVNTVIIYSSEHRFLKSCPSIASPLQIK